jgi:hypothetical protein
MMVATRLSANPAGTDTPERLLGPKVGAKRVGERRNGPAGGLHLGEAHDGPRLRHQPGERREDPDQDADAVP